MVVDAGRAIEREPVSLGPAGRLDVEVVQHLEVIGHEPAVSQLALGLADIGTSNPDAVERISAKYPTSALAVLRVSGPWRSVQLGSAALVDFHVPR